MKWFHIWSVLAFVSFCLYVQWIIRYNTTVSCHTFYDFFLSRNFWHYFVLNLVICCIQLNSMLPFIRISVDFFWLNRWLNICLLSLNYKYIRQGLWFLIPDFLLYESLTITLVSSVLYGTVCNLSAPYMRGI